MGAELFAQKNLCDIANFGSRDHECARNFSRERFTLFALGHGGIEPRIHRDDLVLGDKRKLCFFVKILDSDRLMIGTIAK